MSDLPTVPNAVLIRIMKAGGVDVESFRRKISDIAAEMVSGESIGTELYGIRLIVSGGVVMTVERRDDTKLKVNIG